MKMICPIEYEFRLKFGCYPYEYMERQIKNGYSRKQAFDKVQQSIDKVWLEMKLDMERKENHE